MKNFLYSTLLFMCLLCGGCATVMTSSMNQLSLGQSLDEVKNLLGEPSQSGTSNGALIYKYSTFKPFYGVIPYYVYFTQDDSGVYRVVEYSPNMQEYYNYQRTMTGAVPDIVSSMKQIDATHQQRQQDLEKQHDRGLDSMYKINNQTYQRQVIEQLDKINRNLSY